MFDFLKMGKVIQLEIIMKKKISGIWNKTTKIIKTIEEGGGFGTNGWYLPMNDPYSKGMDFHVTPDVLKINDLFHNQNGLRDGKIEVREDPLRNILLLQSLLFMVDYKMEWETILISLGVKVLP